MVRIRRREDGQATIELVAITPLMVALALAVAQVLAAGAARELAGHAAEAGALAKLQGGDAEVAARESLPGWARGRLDVEVEGEVVRVAVRPVPLIPPLADALVARARAVGG